MPATAPAAAAVTVDELRALFSGDELLAGYPTGPLAGEICKHTRPRTITDLYDAIFGVGWPVDQISNRELHAMRRGYRAWTAAGRPQP